MLPFTMFPPGGENEAGESGEQSIPLFRDRSVIPGVTLQFSVSSDVQSPLPPPNIVGLSSFGLQHVNQRRKVAVFKWRGKTKYGKQETVVTETYNMPE